MAINSSHPIGQHCKWALLPAESLNEQITGTAPGGGTGSVITLPEGNAYLPTTSATTWASSAAIDPYANDITIVYYGRLDASVANAHLVDFVGGYGWELLTGFWDGNIVRLAFYRAFIGNGPAANFGGTGDDNVHHVVIRVNKAAATIDWCLNGVVLSTVAWSSDGSPVSGGSVKMSNSASATNACITCQIYDVALSDSDIASLAANPTQIFAEPPKDLAVANPIQGNAASTGEIGIGGILYGSALTQTNTVSAAPITRVQDLTVSSLTQSNSLPTVSVNPYARLRNILRDLPVNTWVQVNTSRYVDCQMPVSDRPSGYQNDWDHTKIIPAWSCFAFDHTRGNLLLWGGGHADYSGNQLYQWHADTGEWSQSCLPSRLTSDGNYYVVDKLAPQSSHAYNSSFWLKENDMFGSFGGSALPMAGPPLEDDNGTARRVAPWFYDLTKTDPNKVGGSDGSGWDTSRLGLNAWQHRRDKVPTGATSTNVYPIDNADHLSQAAVCVSKDGKDYVIFTMDRSSGFPGWYRYEVGNVRAGENDACTFLGGSGEVLVYEGWMVYDSKRELVYRNSFAFDPNYVKAELAARSPWNVGGGLTPIRLVHTGTGDPFLMQKNDLGSQECPYGAVYDPRNDCVFLWGGTAPDTGVVYRINIPAYDSVTGWASTTWTVDTITPVGSRPNGLYQRPILGKIKHIPEVDAFVVLDSVDTTGSTYESAGVWAFKTAQIPGDLTSSGLGQGNSVSTGTISIGHTLSVGTVAQENTVSNGSITQTQILACENVAQVNAASTGAITKGAEFATAPIVQANTAGTGSISQTHALAGDPATQANVTSSVAISTGDVHNLAASQSTQANTASSGAITQTHVLVFAPSVQDNIAAASAIVQAHIIAALSATQANSASPGAIEQTSGIPPVDAPLGSGPRLRISRERRPAQLR